MRTRSTMLVRVVTSRIWSLIDSNLRAKLTTTSPFAVNVTPGALLSNNSPPSRSAAA